MFNASSLDIEKSASKNAWERLNIPYTLCEVIVGVVAIVGNAMVILVFHKEKRLKRRTNYYIISLAVADFLVGLLGIPFAILSSIGLPTNLYACLLTVSLLIVLCTISIFCLIAVSIDRYWAILYPIKYSKNVSTKTTKVIITICWLAGSLIGFLPFFGWHSRPEHSNSCVFLEVMDYSFLVFLYFATIITPSILMAFFYAHIYHVIIKQVRQTIIMENSKPNQDPTHTVHRMSMLRIDSGTVWRVLGAKKKREIKATQNLSIIVLFFVICWMPLYTINAVLTFCRACNVSSLLMDGSIILSHLNSAINPVLYAYHLKDFREALKKLLLGMFSCGKPKPDRSVRVLAETTGRQQVLVVNNKYKSAFSTKSMARLGTDISVLERNDSSLF